MWNNVVGYEGLSMAGVCLRFKNTMNAWQAWKSVNALF